MTDEDRSASDANVEALEREVARLNKVVRALMHRAESAASVQGSSYGLFETTIVLQEQVHRRTEELETALRENEEITRDLRLSEARFRGLVSQSLAGIAIVEQQRITYANPRAASIFGYEVGEIVLIDPFDLVHPDDRDLVRRQMRRRVSGEVEGVDLVFRGIRRDGEIVDVELHASGMETEGHLALILLVVDVTERLRAEREIQALQAQLREQAIRDPLTGLYNRRYLVDAADRELILAERSARPLSVIMGDLDHFKTVNDTYGHRAGDEVLKSFARLVQERMRASDIPCRYGGEEFVLVLPGMAHADACARAEGLCAGFEAAPTHCCDAVLRVTVSLGVASFPEHGTTLDELVTAADTALFAAKEAGRNRVVSRGAMNRAQ